VLDNRWQQSFKKLTKLKSVKVKLYIFTAASRATERTVNTVENLNVCETTQLNPFY